MTVRQIASKDSVFDKKIDRSPNFIGTGAESRNYQIWGFSVPCLDCGNEGALADTTLVALAVWRLIVTVYPR